MKTHRARAALGAAGAGLAAYALSEPYMYRLGTLDVPVEGLARPFSVLHISDTHMKARDTRLQDFLAGLPDKLQQTPDLVLATGDLIEENEGIDPIVESLARLEGVWGRFYVLGSHDYYISKKRSYAKYFTGRKEKVIAPRADTARLESGLQAKGWQPLTNRSVTVETAAGKVLVAGVDDPYLRRHRTEHITRGDELLAVALVHAPDVVSEWALNSFDLIAAGHTHAGQVRVPGIGAIVTNCSLPATLAGGLHKIGNTWLHVSPGLGNSRFSPVRFNCRPEATLLQLIPYSA